MPRRLGSTKAAPTADDGGLPVVTLVDVHPLDDHLRAQKVAALTETLEHIKAVQADTRDKTGKIKHAKFKASCLALRWEGYSPVDTAQILGVTEGMVQNALRQLRADAKLDTQMARLTEIAIPLAVDNVLRGVANGDKEYTLRVLDGTGVFRGFKSVEAHVKQTILTLTVAVKMPETLLDGSAVPVPPPGAIVGAMAAPKSIAGAVVAAGPLPPAEGVPA